MTEQAAWRAGFEIEVVLGGLGIPQFETIAREYGPMDQASLPFCQAVARLLSQHTSRRWTAPSITPKRPGFYVISEYGLDPLDWPRGRLAGVELLTPPLPFAEADSVRREISDAIFEIDGEFNFWESQVTAECGWHINVDGGEGLRLEPAPFILGTDELLLLAQNGRLFTDYTGLQRHAVGITLLRHLRQDPDGSLLYSTGLLNLVNSSAGTTKGFAANFAKTERGYVELRHFSALAFFDDLALQDILERIPAAMEMRIYQIDPLKKLFRQKFLLLSKWLEANRERITWSVGPMCVVAEGHVLFDGEPLAKLVMNGPADLYIESATSYHFAASMKGINHADVAEGVALLALDLAELRNLDLSRPRPRNKAFGKEVTKLARKLKADPRFSSAHQASILEAARQAREQRTD